MTINGNQCESHTTTTGPSSFRSFDFSELKARLPELNCLHSLQRYFNTDDDDAGGASTQKSKEEGSNYTNNILGYNFGCKSNGFTSYTTDYPNLKETPLQKFYRAQQQKKMPAFRGRRGWCGCFQVSKRTLNLLLIFVDYLEWLDSSNIKRRYVLHLVCSENLLLMCGLRGVINIIPL